jgi:hypothetical protein
VKYDDVWGECHGIEGAKENDAMLRGVGKEKGQGPWADRGGGQSWLRSSSTMHTGTVLSSLLDLASPDLSANIIGFMKGTE